MKLLQVIYVGNADYVDTREYLVIDIDDNEKTIATIYTKTKKVKKVVEEYRELMKETEVTFIYDEETDDEEYSNSGNIKEVD